MLQDEYYVLMRENNNNHPLFSWDQTRGDFCLGNPVSFKEAIKMRLGEPIPPNVEWVDFHKAPEFFISKKIADVLAPLNIDGIQLVPAIVRDPRDPFADTKDYYFLHVWNRISCLDREKSELRMNRKGSLIYSIRKFVLDEKTLSLFELRKRLMFELTEKISVTLVHQSIKDIITATHPRGFRFIKATDWYSDITFD